MKPLTLTVLAVHVESTETGPQGVVTLTGDLDTVRAVGGLLLTEVVLSSAKPETDPEPK